MEEIPFELDSAEGLPIRGRLALAADSSAATIVCVHGFKGFSAWGFWPETARRLTAAGFHAVRFDFSHSGVGEDGETFTQTQLFESGTFSGEVDDLRTVLGAVSASDGPGRGRVDAKRLGLLAHSRGSVSALAAAAAADRAVASIVLWNPVATVLRWDDPTRTRWRREGFWEVANARTGQLFRMGLPLLDDAEGNAPRLDPEKNAARTEIPVLTVIGKDDESVNPDEGRRIARAVPPPLGSLRELPETGHTFGARHPFAETTPALEAAIRATLEHFSRTLRGSRPGAAR